jgi:Domain of unknown function (DU1801)
MAKSENKTTATAADVSGFIDAVADERQRDDARTLRSMMERLSGHPAAMWGASIIGFGSYHYRYDSGREGDMCRIGFSPRKGKTVVYLVDGFPRHAELLGKLGKHKTGVSCLYINRLSDVDLNVLEAMAQSSLDWMAQKYPENE